MRTNIYMRAYNVRPYTVFLITCQQYIAVKTLKAFFHKFQQLQRVKLKRHFSRELQSYNLVFSRLLVEK